MLIRDVIACLMLVTFISVNNGMVQECTITRTWHKTNASVVSYRAGTFEPVEKYEVDVKQRRGKITRIDWNKRK